MTTLRRNICLAALVTLVACAEEPPPISVEEFMADSRLLEATLVRCNQNRSATKYNADCVNARDAIDRLEVREKRARHAELEAQSIRKRQALRQTQEAAAEARRRAQEAERLREEAEYLGVYETLAPAEAVSAPGGGDNTVPVNVAPPSNPPASVPAAVPAAVDSGGPEAGSENDLAAIREELQRRQATPPQN